MNQIKDTGTHRKLGLVLGALGALLLILIALLITVAVQYRMLEQAKQGLVKQHQQELEDLKSSHRSKISDLKKQQQAQDLIIQQERASKDSYRKAFTALESIKNKKNDEIDDMDPPALLYELRSIRTAHQIY